MFIQKPLITTCESSKQKKDLLEVKQQLHRLGFTPEQVMQMLQTRFKRTKNTIPFQKTKIKERYISYKTLLSPLGIQEKELRKLLCQGLIFSQLPTALENLLQFLKEENVDPNSFIQKLLSSEKGCITLSQAPTKTKHNIQLMSEQLSPFGICAKDWIELCFERPGLLQIPPETLLKNIKQMSLFLKEYQKDMSDWVKAAFKNPAVLDKPSTSIIRKIKEMTQFLTSYHIEPKEWLESCFQQPQLFYQTPQKIQNQIHFYENMYQNNLFTFTNHPQQDTTFLLRYLLKSPQYLCYSDKTLQLRKRYAEFLIRTKRPATSAVLYRTKKYILQHMGKEKSS